MKTVFASVVCVVVLACLCAGKPLEQELEPELWFPTSVRQRRDTNGQRPPLNATHVPSSVCRSMAPVHGNCKPKTIASSPYVVSVDKTSISAGDIVTVTVSGTEPFKGIYIQGREEGDDPVGTFQSHDNPAVVISDCEPGQNNALSYVSRTDLDDIVLKWKAPNTPGKVTFKCTVVKTFCDFWVGLTSAQVDIV